MRSITCMLFQREEREALIRASTCIGVGAPSDEQRDEDKRRWNSLLQRHEVLTYEAVERCQIIAMRTLRQCNYEVDPVLLDVTTREHAIATGRADDRGDHRVAAADGR